MLIIRRFLVFNIVFLIVFFALIKMLFWYNFQPTGHFMYRVPHNSHYGDIIATSRREIELEFAVNENIRVPVDKIRNVIVTTWRSGSTFLGKSYRIIVQHFISNFLRKFLQPFSKLKFSNLFIEK